MKQVIIVSHKNTDTDSVVVTLVLAEFLKKTKEPILGFSDFVPEPKRTGGLNKETEFVLNYFKQDIPPLIKNIEGKKVFLVDHSSYEQAVEGIKKAEIVGVLDHHKIGDIKTSSPIFYRAEPLGSSSTLLAKMFLEKEISLDKKEAGLLLSGILSDTLNLSSPTTTEEDKRIVKKLSDISQEKPDKLIAKMFEAKSDINDISSEELVEKDYKEFEVSGKRFGIGVWETTNPSQIEKRKKEILSALNKLKKERNLQLIFFASVNVLKAESILYLPNKEEKEIAEKVFEKKEKDNLILLPLVVSRKKQILPPIIKFLEKQNEN